VSAPNLFTKISEADLGNADMAHASDFLRGQPTFTYERSKTTAKKIIEAFPATCNSDVDVENRHAQYCLEVTTYNDVKTSLPQYVEPPSS
jgi:hypothetical protein